jgi:nucleoid-associated protein YgaU
MISKSGMWGPVTTSGGALICAMVLVGWWFVRMPRPHSPAPQQEAENLTNPSISQRRPAPPATPQPTTVAESSAPSDALSGPRIDVVRIAQNGDVVVAGRAAPGAKVALLDGGEILLETRADPATGEFVFLPPRLGAGAHRLALRSSNSSGDTEMRESLVQAFSIAPQSKTANADGSTPSGAVVGGTAPHALEAGVRSGKATIVQGDTLWRISREKLGRGALYPTIYQANSTKIRNPNRIYPDQILTIP